MGENIPGENFPGGNFPGGRKFSGGAWWVWFFRVGIVPERIFLEPQKALANGCFYDLKTLHTNFPWSYYFRLPYFIYNK